MKLKINKKPLKLLNKQNELLCEAQLEQVAGGQVQVKARFRFSLTTTKAPCEQVGQ